MDMLRHIGHDIAEDAKFFWWGYRRKKLRSMLILVGWMIGHGIWDGTLRFLRYGLKGVEWHLEIRELERSFYKQYDLYRFMEWFIGGMCHRDGFSSKGAALEYEAEKAAQIQYSRDEVDAIKIKLDQALRNHP